MRGKKLKFAVAGLAIVLAVGVLAYFAVRGNSVYYYTVRELTAKGSTDGVRVAGDLINGTLQKVGVGEPIRFEIADQGTTTPALSVTYAGPVPDTFKDDPANPVEVVVDGDYRSDGTFQATSLLAKCPSKYQAAQDGASGQ
ncbi:MAG: cytochrome c maturation protein CcmE [Actinobacteria bacterium]|nr:cytochrome c maturation protein CcmE [Actinomycetota bacterium]